MEAKDIANKAKKVIDLHAKDYVYNKVYFNPVFLREFYADVPELKEAGIKIEVKETESTEGTLISGAFVNHRTMELGSMLLDGEDMVVHTRLQTVDHLIRFIRQEAEAVDTKTIEEKEEDIIGEDLDLEPEPIPEEDEEAPVPEPEPAPPKKKPLRVRPEPEPEEPKRPRVRHKTIERI
jgi:hypothetical protein